MKLMARKRRAISHTGSVLVIIKHIHSAVIIASILLASEAPVRAESHIGILGYWINDTGTLIHVAECDKRICASITSGQDAGTIIAEVSNTGPEHRGILIDHMNDENYDGTLTVKGEALEVRTCIFSIYCPYVQRWQKLDER